MDRQVLVKLIRPLVAILIPAGGTQEKLSVGSLLAGGGILQVVETVQKVQGLLASGTLPETLAEQCPEELLEELARVLREANYYQLDPRQVEG